MMESYWWILIVIAVAVIGYIKLKVWNMISTRKKEIELEDEF